MAKKAVRRTNADGGRLLPPKKGVTVRMYNTGFGDCFLLAFPTDDDDDGAFYVMIDCGVHNDFKGGDERMRLVVKDIARATGKWIDVVAITHEHADHISGFGYAEDIFDKKEIEIGELWLAWTEDPADPLAIELKRLYGARLKALQAAITRLRAMGSPVADSLERVMGFDLIPGKELGLAGDKDIMEDLRRWSGKKIESYRTPERSPIDLQGVSEARCYVLGPPRDVKAIRKLVDKDEMFSNVAKPDAEMAFMAALNANPGQDEGNELCGEDEEIEDEELMGLLYPFDKGLRIPEDRAHTDENYKAFFSRYRGRKEDAWRKIDADWLGAADRLALSINKMTNNTSLALAFELIDSGRILLFTGDAQIGSWLYWKDLEWPINGGPGKIRGEDLIKRTVLYKVGHHGSLNATPKKSGLDLMNRGDIVAMIPVNEEWAIKRGWRHPDAKILEALMTKAKGRVIRSDRIAEDVGKKPPAASESEWNEFQKNLEWDRSPDRLWIQYTVQ